MGTYTERGEWVERVLSRVTAMPGTSWEVSEQVPFDLGLVQVRLRMRVPDSRRQVATGAVEPTSLRLNWERMDVTPTRTIVVQEVLGHPSIEIAQLLAVPEYVFVGPQGYSEDRLLDWFRTALVALVVHELDEWLRAMNVDESMVRLEKAPWESSEMPREGSDLQTTLDGLLGDPDHPFKHGWK